MAVRFVRPSTGSCVVLALMTLVFVGIGARCLIDGITKINRPFPGFLVNQRLVFGGIGRSGWTGAKARLQYPDKIVSINGQPVQGIDEMAAMVSQVPTGTGLIYGISRRGAVVEKTIRTMVFTLADFLTIFGPYFLSGILYFLTGMIVLLLKPGQGVSWAFFHACYW